MEILPRSSHIHIKSISGKAKWDAHMELLKSKVYIRPRKARMRRFSKKISSNKRDLGHTKRHSNR